MWKDWGWAFRKSNCNNDIHGVSDLVMGLQNSTPIPMNLQ